MLTFFLLYVFTDNVFRLFLFTYENICEKGVEPYGEHGNKRPFENQQDLK